MALTEIELVEKLKAGTATVEEAIDFAKASPTINEPAKKRIGALVSGFKKMGLDVYVVPLKSADPKKKAEYIENKIKSGYTDVYFIDDSSKNVRAVQALQVKYPNVKIKTVKA